jgi:excisionase family DNA binding protein
MKRGNGGSAPHSEVAAPGTTRLLDVHEAATLLGVKPATLYQWAYQRRVPVVKLLGHALRFRRTDLEELIEAGMRPARVPPKVS